MFPQRLAAALCSVVCSAALLSAAPQESQDLWTQSGAYRSEDTVYASLSAVTAILAPDVQFTWQDGTARGTADGLSIEAAAGAPYLTVNSRVLYCPEGIQAQDGRVMVPLEAYAALLDGAVVWQSPDDFGLTPGSGMPGPAPYTEEDLYWMSRVISSESRGEPLEGKLAVGTVVLNRVASDEFPDTIPAVIFDRQYAVQFTPVANGTVFDRPTEESVLAARMVLEGARAAGDSLYFIAPELTDNHWVMEHQEYVTTIGAHWFYR